MNVGNGVSVGGAAELFIVDHGAAANSLVKVDWTNSCFGLQPSSTFALEYEVDLVKAGLNFAPTFAGLLPSDNFTSLVNDVSISNTT